MGSNMLDLILTTLCGWWEFEGYGDKDLTHNTALPSIITLSDLETAVEGLCALADCAIELGQGITTWRTNQDVLENWFGHHEQDGG